MTLEYRRATLADLPAICALGRDVNLLHAGARPDIFAPAADPAQLEALWRRAIETAAGAAFIAERGATAAGFITGHISPERSPFFLPMRICHVGTLGVVEPERGQGVGRALMALLEAWAGEQSADEIQLTVWRFNERALRLYRELGYEERSVSMGKRLGGSAPPRA